MIISDPQSTHEFLVLKWLDLFKKTGNPIYAWRTYQNARRLRLLVPDEIMQYFDGVADGIIRSIKTPAKNRPAKITQALGLGKKGAGRGSPIEDNQKWMDGRRMAIKTHSELEDHGKRYIVFEGFADKYKIGKSTVERNYNSHLERWEREAQYLLDAGLVSQKKDGSWRLVKPFCGDADDMREVAIILSFLPTID